MRAKLLELVGHGALVLLSLLAPIHPLLMAVGAMIFFDLFTGVIAAHKRGEVITSAILRRTVTKVLVYQLAVITGFILEHYMLAEILPVSKMVAGAVGITEFKSIVENLSSIQGEPLLKDVLKRLGSDNERNEPKA